MLKVKRYEAVVDGRKESGLVDLSGGSAIIRIKGVEASVSYSKNRFDLSFVPTEDCVIESLSLVSDVADIGSNAAFLRNGYQSWSYSGALGAGEKQSRPRASFVHANQENICNVPTGKKGKHTSEMFFFYGDRNTQQGFLVAQYPPFNQYLSFLFSFGRNNHQLRMTWDLHKKVKRRETYALDPVIISEGSCNDLLESYGKKISSLTKNRINDGLRAGWCSWYYYFTKITPDCILSNLDYAKKNKIQYDFFQIDDGYQTTIGDWLIQTQPFNGRMKEIAQKIKKAGYVPGLWLAPFIISRKSVHFNKPGWVLKNKKGKPVVAGWNPAWGVGMDYSYFALDITHPEVQDYLRTVFTTVKKEWGYDYIKLDFMYAASLPGERYDKTLSRAEVLKMGNKLIRDVVGKDQVILGCGMPISAAVGYIDAMRVSCDVAPYWLPNWMDKALNTESGIETRGAIRNSMARSFMDKSFWINDPDCLMLRTVNTQLTKEERRSLYNLVMTVGGLLVTSDDFGLYGEGELQNLRSAIEIFKSTHKGKATALDILSGRLPEILSNSAGFISLFNFSDQPAVKTLSAELLASAGFSKRRIVKNIETGERYDLSKPAGISLGVHDSAMFKIEG